MFSNWIYKCTFESSWSTCGMEIREPKQHLVNIPDDTLTKYPLLRERRGVRTRALHPFKLFDDHGNDLVYGFVFYFCQSKYFCCKCFENSTHSLHHLFIHRPYKKPLLFNMEFVLIGDLTKPRSEIERMIRKLGGKVSAKIHDRLAAIISNTNEVEKMGKQMNDACMNNIQVVSEDFLDATENSDIDPIAYILSENICDWGGDVSSIEIGFF